MREVLTPSRNGTNRTNTQLLQPHVQRRRNSKQKLQKNGTRRQRLPPYIKRKVFKRSNHYV